MSELLLYLAKMFVCTGTLFGYYVLFLKDKPFHRYNRFFLLMTMLAGVTFPLLNFTFLFSGNSPHLFHFDSVAIYIRPTSGIDVDVLGLSLERVASSIYVFVVLILLFRLAVSLFRMHRLRQDHPYQRIGKHVRLYRIDDKRAPFSFMQHIFWNNSIDMYSDRGLLILKHEICHVRQRHTLDLLFAELIITLAWINPFFHLIKRELSTVHEYLADRDAIYGEDPQDYAAMLVQNALDRRRSGHLIRSFFHPPLKRRITMILQKSAGRPARLARILALPVIIVILSSFALTAYIPGTNTEIGGARSINADTLREPSFKGGISAWQKFLINSLSYPPEAQEKKKQGTAIVTFTVNANGTVSGERLLQDPGFGMGNEALRIVRLSSGKWEAARQNGQAVAAKKSQPFVFRLH